MMNSPRVCSKWPSLYLLLCSCLQSNVKQGSVITHDLRLCFYHYLNKHYKCPPTSAPPAPDSSAAHCRHSPGPRPDTQARRLRPDQRLTWTLGDSEDHLISRDIQLEKKMSCAALSIFFRTFGLGIKRCCFKGQWKLTNKPFM